MKMSIAVVSICCILAVGGCGTTQSVQTRATPVIDTTKAQVKVTVGLYRQRPVAVPISTQGATLRSVLAGAKDQLSLGGEIVNAFVLNDVSTFAREAGVLEQDVNDALDQVRLKERIHVGGELVVLQRGNLLLFIPGVMIIDTAAGNVRVMPGDGIATVPLSTLDELGEDTTDFSGNAGSAPTGRVSVTLGGDYFAEMKVDVPIERTIGELLNFSGWTDLYEIDAQLPKFDLNQVNPNAVVVLRPTIDGMLRLAILPAEVTLETDQTPLAGEGRLTNDFGDVFKASGYLNLKLREGDQVLLTRLERIPLIAAGLASRVASR